MTPSLLSRLKNSRQRLESLQEDLMEGKDNMREQSARLRHRFEERSSDVAGRMRDASLTTIYEFGATTFTRAAELGDKAPMVKEGAVRLRQTAEALEEAREAVSRPAIADYDNLNVKEVAQALDGLSNYELEKVRRYEAANKDRVTVLRDIEQRIEG